MLLKIHPKDRSQDTPIDSKTCSSKSENTCWEGAELDEHWSLRINTRYMIHVPKCSISMKSIFNMSMPRAYEAYDIANPKCSQIIAM